MGVVTRLLGDALVADLLAVAAELVANWPELREAVGEQAQTQAQKTVRKKTKRLSESIQVLDTGVMTHVWTDLRYAWPVHAGVPKEGMAPNRFLLPLAYELDPTETWERMSTERLKEAGA